MFFRKANWTSFPVAVFVAFLAAVVIATLYYSPSWGLMDDWLNLQTIYKMQHNAYPLAVFLGRLWEDATKFGIFRPTSHVWVAVIYPVFEKVPTAAYIALAIINMGILPFWGLVFSEFFSVDKKYPAKVLFFFPLSFFLFTPFWNIFMYISLPDKFIVWFSAFALYFFKKSYDSLKVRDMGWCFLFVVLAIFGKPTGIFLPMIFALYAGFDYWIARFRPKLSLRYLLISLLLVAVYAVFTFQVQLKGDYTAPYADNLRPLMFLKRLVATPFIIKLLLGFSSVFCLYQLWDYAKNKRNYLPFSILLSLGLGVYLFLLVPWGFHSYHFCVFAPFILGMFFPFYLWMDKKSTRWRMMANSFIAVMLFLVFVGVIVPRISKMADIRKTIEFMKQEAASRGNGRYFIPFHCTEASVSLQYFTGQRVVYLARENLVKGLLDKKAPNYYLVNDQCRDVRLSNVRLEDTVFSNDTWKVVRLKEEDGHGETLQFDFPKTPLQRAAVFIKEIK